MMENLAISPASAFSLHPADMGCNASNLAKVMLTAQLDDVIHVMMCGAWMPSAHSSKGILVTSLPDSDEIWRQFVQV